MENKDSLLKGAMFYGLLLGIFWAIKYVFLIIGSWYSGVGTIYLILSPLTLVFTYYMTKAYKIISGGKISFFRAWQFGVLLYFFAALIVSLEHFAFYRHFAPPGFIANSMDQVISLMRSMELNEQMKQIVDQMATPTPIQMTIQGIFNNVFYGIILSIPVAALLSRNESSRTIDQINQDNQEENHL